MLAERSRREGLYVYIQLIHFIVQQKSTQHCKAVILRYETLASLDRRQRSEEGPVNSEWR